MNKQIYSLLGTIGASPYMQGAKRLNSQYAGVETLYEQGAYVGCVAACSTLFEQLMAGLYLGVTGADERLPVILSDIGFWDVIADKTFCDTAGMLQYACYRLESEDGETPDPKKAAELARTGLDDVIERIARFLAKHAERKCVDPAILARDELRRGVCRLADTLREQMEGAGCSDGFSMQPPYMNACLLDLPERENAVWTRFIAQRLQKAGLLTSSQIETLDAEWVVDEKVGLTNELIRRAAAKANGGALLIERFDAFDMPCLGGNLLDRALRTILTAAETYRGSLCIVVTGQGENAAKAFARAENGAERFPLIVQTAAEAQA